RRARALQVLAQPRSFRSPAAHADVDVVALREDPGVAAGNRPEVDHRTPLPAVLARVRIGDVALERDAVPPRAETEGPRGQAVDAVGADHDRRGRGCSVEADRAPAAVQL